MRFPVAVSMTSVRVENAASAYEWPVSNTVVAARRPSGDTRARIGGPVSGIVCRLVKDRSKRTASCRTGITVESVIMQTPAPAA
jgi:hypothetical protein